jgi:hypothetical protein
MTPNGTAPVTLSLYISCTLRAIAGGMGLMSGFLNSALVCSMTPWMNSSSKSFRCGGFAAVSAGRGSAGAGKISAGRDIDAVCSVGRASVAVSRGSALSSIWRKQQYSTLLNFFYIIENISV